MKVKKNWLPDDVRFSDFNNIFCYFSWIWHPQDVQCPQRSFNGTKESSDLVNFFASQGNTTTFIMIFCTQLNISPILTSTGNTSAESWQIRRYFSNFTDFSHHLLLPDLNWWFLPIFLWSLIKFYLSWNLEVSSSDYWEPTKAARFRLHTWLRVETESWYFLCRSAGSAVCLLLSLTAFNSVSWAWTKPTKPIKKLVK